MRHMLSRVCIAVALVSASVAGVAPVGAQPVMASLASLPKYAAVLMDPQTGEILYARNPDAARHPASITKVMTMYIAFEEIEAGRLRMTEPLTFSQHARSQPPSKLGIREGQTITIEQALNALATKSANDVAVALAERISGSEVHFAQRMNERARAIGMNATNFANASGLPNPAHRTTARDIATLSYAMLQRYPGYYDIFRRQQFEFGGRVMPNHNKLLGRTPGVDGIKTGYTAASGYTLAASARRGDRRLIAVVLGAPTGRARDDNVEALLNAGFDVLDGRRFGRQDTVAALVDTRVQPLDLWDNLMVANGDADVTTRGGAVRVSASPPANPWLSAPLGGAQVQASGKKSGTDK